ncbi:hypothetical protein T11_7599 [Trichinella zimbabwensis]|uniref:Uncharacterized protein n=1 Tax=Trichinella zimbabwensis TaxID=268475 RepID=A0A0V1HBN9_9BILA|nr:hypothetical protein T11_7599 [Trichinella zimbabwensis]
MSRELKFYFQLRFTLCRNKKAKRSCNHERSLPVAIKATNQRERKRRRAGWQQATFSERRSVFASSQEGRRSQQTSERGLKPKRH